MKTSLNQIKFNFKVLPFMYVLASCILMACSENTDDSGPITDDPIEIEDTVQEVTTLVSNSKIKDGLFVDDMGHIYTTSGGLQNGTQIGKYNIDTGGYTINFKTGFFGPIDIDQKSDGLFVVTNYDNNTVTTVDINTSAVTNIASGLDGPAGIAIDSEDNIYITNFGAPPSYSGHQIHKISSAGELTILTDSPFLNRFQAIVINAEGDLIVSSNNKLYKVNPDTGSIQLWVDLVNIGFGHMVYRLKDSCIYGTSSTGKVYKIDTSGEATVFAGSSPGILDGDLSVAQFNKPLGIELSPDEGIMYISDSSKLRRIIFP